MQCLNKSNSSNHSRSQLSIPAINDSVFSDEKEKVIPEHQHQLVHSSSVKPQILPAEEMSDDVEEAKVQHHPNAAGQNQWMNFLGEAMPEEQHFPAGFTMQPGHFDHTSEQELSNHSQSFKTSEKYQQLHYFHEEE